MQHESTPKITGRAGRFWSKVEFRGTCWLWTGSGTAGGYGQFWDAPRTVLSHRWAYEFCVGPIPEGLTLDHLCRVRNCVNPDHLEPVTMRENVLRGSGPTAIRARKTHCKWGHEFTPENTILKSAGRQCRLCHYVANNDRRRQNLDQRAAYMRSYRQRQNEVMS